MSHRASTVLFLAAFVVLLRLILSGKLARAGKALIGPRPPSDASSSGAGSGAGAGGTPNPGKPPASLSSYPDSSLFGLPGGIQPYDMIAQQPGSDAATGDRAGFASVFGSSAVAIHDWDYGRPAVGDRVLLPPGIWTLEASDPDPRWGDIEYWQETHGAHMQLTHVGNDPFKVGQSEPGGTYVGQTIRPPLGNVNNPFWSGPHLSVVVDQVGANWLLGVA